MCIVNQIKIQAGNMKGSKKLLQIGEEVGEKLESELVPGGRSVGAGQGLYLSPKSHGVRFATCHITRGSVHPPHHPSGASVLGLAATWENKE